MLLQVFPVCVLLHLQGGSSREAGCQRQESSWVEEGRAQDISEAFPSGSVVKNLPPNKGSIPGPGGSHMLWSN